MPILKTFCICIKTLAERIEGKKKKETKKKKEKTATKPTKTDIYAHSATDDQHFE